jgi:protein-disulfide isomerase
MLLPARLLLLGALLATACAPAADVKPANAATAATAAGPDSAAGYDTALLAAADAGRILGSASARVYLLMVSDFQCPYCAMFHDSTYADVKRAYVDNGKVRLAYMNLPLPTHDNAWPAAEAAMCASAQGKFWPMHDSIFGSQARWASIASPDTMFARQAQATGVDTARYGRCVRTHATRPLIQADADRVSNTGVRSTPTFIVGDSVIPGAYPFPVFQRVLDAVLAATPTRR